MTPRGGSETAPHGEVYFGELEEQCVAVPGTSSRRSVTPRSREGWTEDAPASARSLTSSMTSVQKARQSKTTAGEIESILGLFEERKDSVQAEPQDSHSCLGRSREKQFGSRCQLQSVK